MLDKTAAKQENAKVMLKGVRALMVQRTNLVEQLDYQLVALDDSIDDKNFEIKVLERAIDTMKQEFADLLYESYKNKNRQSVFHELLNSRALSEAYQKISLMEKLAIYRKTQLNLILDQQSINRARLSELLDIKQSRSMVLREKQNELKRLEYSIEKEKKVIALLKGKEKELASELSQKQQQLNKLESSIREAIAQGQAAGSDSSWKAYEQELYPDLLPYFDRNKGRLPWPVKDYIVSGQFGSSAHPDMENVMIQNNGVDLLVNPSESVHAVFDGIVSRVMRIPGLGISLLIKHDNYYTVYANLDNIFVSESDEVSTGQRIGQAINGNDLVEFHFELWKGARKQNPEHWLRAQ